MFLKRIFTLILFLFIPFLLHAHEIHMKNGKIYKVDVFVENDKEIVIEKYETTLYLDKDNIEKIEINYNQTADAVAKKRREKLEKRHRTDNCYLYLKNGKILKTIKTSLEGDFVACTTKTGVIYLRPDEISFSTKKIISVPNSTSKNDDFWDQFKPGSSKSINSYSNQKSERKGRWIESEICRCCRGAGNVFNREDMPTTYGNRCSCCNGTGVRKTVHENW